MNQSCRRGVIFLDHTNDVFALKRVYLWKKKWELEWCSFESICEDGIARMAGKHGICNHGHYAMIWYDWVAVLQIYPLTCHLPHLCYKQSHAASCNHDNPYHRFDPHFWGFDPICVGSDMRQLDSDSFLWLDWIRVWWIRYGVWWIGYRVWWIGYMFLFESCLQICFAMAILLTFIVFKKLRN